MKTAIRKEQAGISKGGSTGQALVKASNTDYDVDWGSPTGSTKLLLDATDGPVTADNAEHDMYSKTIPGGILGDNSAIRFRIPISVGTGANGTWTMKLKYGGTLLGTLTVGNPAGTISGDGYLEGIIYADGSDQDQKSEFGCVITPNPPNSSPTPVENGASSIDSSVNQLLVITGQSSNSGGLTGKGILIEVIQ